MEEEKKGGIKKRRAAVVLLLLIIVGAAIGLRLWVHSKTHISTDDAFIETHTYEISSRVPGYVSAVFVADNQPVKKGDPLVALDAADYNAQVSDAAAALDVSKNDIRSDYANLDSAKASVRLARAQLELSELDLARGKELYQKGIIPKGQLDALTTERSVAQSRLSASEEAVRKAEADIGLLVKGGNEAKVEQKKAQLEAARLRLAYTAINSPADGYITRKSVVPGVNVQPGQPMMALVDLDDIWITANYKETQLTRVRPGMKVEFEVDTYPGHTFSGTVDSIMAGSGAAFSLLPPENATGNYVKVVQRIPVKIKIDRASDPEHVLRVGMSVVPTILTGRRLRDILGDINPF